MCFLIYQGVASSEKDRKGLSNAEISFIQALLFLLCHIFVSYGLAFRRIKWLGLDRGQITDMFLAKLNEDSHSPRKKSSMFSSLPVVGKWSTRKSSSARGGSGSGTERKGESETSKTGDGLVQT